MQVHGSCHCGQIRYEATIDPEQVSICHCTDCQKLSGAPYRASIRSIGDSFQLLSGEPSVYVKVADSGARRAQAFCPNCGSSLYTYDADKPTVYGLRLGVLEERTALIPKKQIWCRSALGWTQNLTDVERRDTV